MIAPCTVMPAVRSGAGRSRLQAISVSLCARQRSTDEVRAGETYR